MRAGSVATTVADAAESRGRDRTAMTRVVEIRLFHARIPLLKKVEHASAVRQESDNLIVRVRLASGIVGFGEGVPREYVTGETIDGAFEQLLRTDLRGLGEPTDLDGAVRLCQDLELWQPKPDPRGCYGNAARCALELALLDAWCRALGAPLSAVAPVVSRAVALAPSPARVRYGHVITVGTFKKEFLRALRTRLYGFRDCKVKVGVDGHDDARRLRRIRRVLGRRMDVRIDANEAWAASEVAARIRGLQRFHISAVEQPVRHEDVAVLAAVRRDVPVPIMHDESVCSLTDARAAIEQETCDLFNIRLSKCGGFVRSLQIAALAAEHGLGYQLGCQVGETGILSAAGRHFALSVAGIRYIEGSYDRHLVAERLTCEDLTFGYGGWAPALTGPGLGIVVDEPGLDRVTVHQETIALG